MELKELVNEELVKKYSVSIPAAEVSKEIESKAQAMIKQANIPGFRIGKVPLNVIKSRYKDSLKSEIINHFVNSVSEGILKDNNFEIIQAPKIEDINFAEGKNLTFNIELQLLPHIEKISYKSIHLNRYSADVSEKEMDEAIKRLQKNNQTLETALEGAPAKKGDVVLIDAIGSIDGVEFEGGKVQDKNLELGSNEFISGFEDALVDAKVGDIVNINISFPENYWMKDHAGKPVLFVTTVKGLSTAKLPDIDDEFAQKFKLKDVQELKNELTKSLSENHKSLSDAVMKKELLDYFDKTISISLPPSMLEGEENFLNRNSSSEKKEETRKLAERRVKLGLILADIARKEKLRITEQDVRQEISKHIMSAPHQSKEILEYYQNNKPAIESLKGKILEDKAVRFIFDNSTIQEHKITLDELQAKYTQIDLT